MLEQRVEQLPDDPSPLLLLGELQRRVGSLDQAFAALDKALKLDPQNERVRLVRAAYIVERAHGSAEGMAEVKAILAQVLEENPNSVLGLFTEAKFLLVEGELEEAASRLRRVLDEQPNANAHVLLGTAYLRLGQRELARSEFLQGEGSVLKPVAHHLLGPSRPQASPAAHPTQLGAVSVNPTGLALWLSAFSPQPSAICRSNRLTR